MITALIKVIGTCIAAYLISLVWLVLKWFSNITGRVPRINGSIKKLYEEYGESVTLELCNLAFKDQKEINEYYSINRARRTEIRRLSNGDLSAEENKLLDKEYYMLKDIEELIGDLQLQEKEYKNARKIISKTIEKQKTQTS